MAADMRHMKSEAELEEAAGTVTATRKGPSIVYCVRPCISVNITGLPHLLSTATCEPDHLTG
eukprot:3046601-Pyramimonas_sp.AAC.1